MMPDTRGHAWSRRDFLAQASAIGAVASLTTRRLSGTTEATNSIAVDDLPYASATAIAAAIRAKKISAVELTQLMIRRVHDLNPKLNAIATLLDEEAMTHARECDRATAHGRSFGPLHGVPVTVKECFGIRGVRQTLGLHALEHHLAPEDSVAVARLRSAGAIILGNTNLAIMVADWQSYNDFYGQANNPWNLAMTPGGSTGGGAAATAAGLGYITLGGDIGGSIRVPAHFCGVYGHKTSLNVIPQRGNLPPMPSDQPAPPEYLPVMGPLARSANDLKLALEIVGGPDEPDSVAYRWNLPAARASHLSGYRAGFALDDELCPTTSEMRAVLKAAVDALRSAGVAMEEGLPRDLKTAADFADYKYLLATVRAGAMKASDIEKAQEIAKRNDDSDEVIEARAVTDPHKMFRGARRRQIVARDVWQRYFKSHDVFLIPVAFTTAIPHDHRPDAERTITTPEGSRRYDDLLFWSSFATFSGLPSTVAPVGFTRSRLPVGIQIIGPYLEDATSIDFAAKLAIIIGGYQRPPLSS